MSDRLIISLKRWGDMLIYGALGAFAFDCIGSPWGSLIQLGVWGDWLAQHPFIVDSGLFLALVEANKIVRSRLRHFRYATSYPPLAMAVLIALGMASLSLALGSTQPAGQFYLWLRPLIAGAIFVIAWNLEDSIAIALSWVRNIKHVRAPQPKTSGQRRQSSLTDDELRTWLHREEPIGETSADLFNHYLIAETLLERLGRKENTIALQGDFGSGKSSVVSMAVRLAGERNAPLIFARVSCWGFDDAAKAQKAVLSALIDRLAQEVDCLVLRDIPTAYLHAIGEQIGWLKSVGLLLESRSPLQLLERLSPLLNAIGRRAVVVIEDADRNGSNFDIGQIQALLVEFRQVKGISFILAISSGQQVDFGRICDYLEIVPRLEKGDVLSMIYRVREMLLRAYPPNVLLDRLEELPADDEEYPFRSSFLTYHWPWPLGLWGLLNNPRALKHALRRILAVWPQLSGEVRIDDLISVAALRIGAPEAFTFFANNRDYFKAAAQAPDKNLTISTKLPESLRQEWNQLVQTNRFDARAAACIMKRLDAHTGAVTGSMESMILAVQAITSERRGPVYARRLLTESVHQDPVSDQCMLQMLKGSRTDEYVLRKLATTILHSDFASLAFEDLGASYQYKDSVLSLTTELYALLRHQKGHSASLGNQPGPQSAWRLVRQDYPEGWKDWLAAELKNCIPHHWRLFADIYHCWVGDKAYVRAELAAIRQAVYIMLKESWESLETLKFADGFDPGFPYTLSHLVLGAYLRNSDGVPYTKAEEWPWLGKILQAAAKANPSVMLPQIMMLLNTASGDPMRLRYAYDEAMLSFWFENSQAELLEQIARGFNIPAQMREDSKYTIESGIEQAKLLLASYDIR